MTSAETRSHLIIHDVDRDGWGSAALLVATLGPEACDLRPTRSKNVTPITNDADRNQHVWVLDIPAPASWASLIEPATGITWVDHHLATWTKPAPSWVRTVLPADNAPTTTMSLLLKHGLAAVEGSRDFVRRLCTSDDDRWGLAFDGLAEMYPELPVLLDHLPELLAGAATGGDIPVALTQAVDVARHQREVVDEVLAAVAHMTIEPGLVVAHIENARRVPLARYSLALGRRHPGRLVAIVHRRQRLYCGQNSQRPGLDLIEHFRSRRLDARGHPYVCNVDVPSHSIENELAALRHAMGIDT